MKKILTAAALAIGVLGLGGMAECGMTKIVNKTIQTITVNSSAGMYGGVTYTVPANMFCEVGDGNWISITADNGATGLAGTIRLPSLLTLSSGWDVTEKKGALHINASSGLKPVSN